MTDCSWNEASGGDLTPYHRASERVYRRLQFFQHLAVFGGVMLALLVVDLFHHLFAGSGEILVPWVGGIWGTILAAHFFYAFLVAEWLGPELERRLTEKEARQLERRMENHE